MFFVDMVGDELYCYDQAVPITAGQGHESDAVLVFGSVLGFA